jgi:hypothetical protein
MTRLIALPPCGRGLGLGACAAVVEAGHLRCVRCGCIAPLPPNFNIETAAAWRSPLPPNFNIETAAAWRSPRPMNEPTQRQEGREMFDDFHKQAAELVLDVAEKSGLLQAAAEKLCLALGDDGEMREALAEAFDRQAADMNRPPRRCPECDGRVPRLRCAECNYKLRGADLLPELWAAFCIEVRRSLSGIKTL